MELTRRDLITAITATTAIAGLSELDDILASSEALNAHQIDTIIAVARVVYPSDLDNIDTFVKKYSIARISDRPQYKGNVQTAIRSLDTYTKAWYDTLYSELSTAEADKALRDMGVDSADPDPEGAPRQQVRFYLVNELLYALYTTPTGATLIGQQNPIGHPGGIESYQTKPQ